MALAVGPQDSRGSDGSSEAVFPPEHTVTGWPRQGKLLSLHGLAV